MFNHLRSVHVKEKPYKCRYKNCAKTFWDKNQMLNHMKKTHIQSELKFLSLKIVKKFQNER
jgi:hypothetical protein